MEDNTDSDYYNMYIKQKALYLSLKGGKSQPVKQAGGNKDVETCDKINMDVENNITLELESLGYKVNVVKLSMKNKMTIEDASPPNISYDFEFDIFVGNIPMKIKYIFDTDGITYSDGTGGYYADFKISADLPDFTFEYILSKSEYGFTYPDEEQIQGEYVWRKKNEKNTDHDGSIIITKNKNKTNNETTMSVEKVINVVVNVMAVYRKQFNKICARQLLMS